VGFQLFTALNHASFAGRKAALLTSTFLIFHFSFLLGQ